VPEIENFLDVCWLESGDSSGILVD